MDPIVTSRGHVVSIEPSVPLMGPGRRLIELPDGWYWDADPRTPWYAFRDGHFVVRFMGGATAVCDCADATDVLGEWWPLEHAITITVEPRR